MFRRAGHDFNARVPVSDGDHPGRGPAAGEHQVRHARRPRGDSELRPDPHRPVLLRPGRRSRVFRVLLLHGTYREQVARNRRAAAGDEAQTAVHRDPGRRGDVAGAGQLQARV